MKRILLLTVYSFISLSYAARAQSWQWGKSGGGNSISQYYGPYDNVIDMATDKWGNVYVLGSAFGDQIYLGGQIRSGNGFGDICIASYKCDGTYRWGKIIGAANNDIGTAIRTDTLGGVYITGNVTGEQEFGHVHVDTDTTLAYTNKSFFIVKYDTAGTYKWFVMPQADTAVQSTLGYTSPKDMDVDGGGNISVFCELLPSVYANSYIVTGPVGLHILKYNASGTFISGFKLQITYNAPGLPFAMHMKWDYKRDRYYVDGAYPYYMYADTLYFGNTLISHPSYIGSFNNSGAAIWIKQNTDTEGNGIQFRPVIDDSGYIYIAGSTEKGDTFNNYVFINPLSVIPYSIPYAVKLDSNGNNVWVVNAESENADNQNYAIGYSRGIIGMWGNYYGHLRLGNFDISSVPNTGARPYLAEINAYTGVILNLDTLTATFGTDVNASAIAGDRLGNFYAGGSLASSLYVANDTLNNSGGEQDFFAAKFGQNNCNCTAAPTASFTFTGGSTLSFIFTGTTPADSIKWTFGDGGTSMAINPTHTYSIQGNYTVCVTVYTACGSNSYCQSVSTTAVGDIAIHGADIYPNPVSDRLVIEHAEIGATVKLFNVIGQQVYMSTVTTDKYIINTRILATGTYVLQLIDTDGNRSSATIVKQ